MKTHLSLELITRKFEGVSGYLDKVCVKKVEDALDNVVVKKPTKRILSAIEYKDRTTQTEFEEKL